MKKITLTSLLFLFFSFISKADIQHQIDEVLLYPDAAKIKRSVKLSTDSMDHEGWISLDWIPQNIDQKRIQAISKTAGISVKDLQFSLIETDQLKDEASIQKIQKQIDALEKEVLEIQQRKNLAKGKVEFSKQLRDSVSESYGKNPLGNDAVHQAKQIWEYTEENVILATQSINDCNEALKEILRKLEPLKKEKTKRLDELKNLLGKIKIQLSASETEEVELSLEYWAYNCHWFPRYELRADLDKKLIKFSYQAEIAQNSGEDWNDVKCTFNTYTINRNGMAPILNDQILQPHSNYQRSVSGDSFSRSKVMEAAPIQKEAMAPLQSKRGFASFEIIANERLTISNNKSQKLDLINKEIEAKFWSEIIATVELRAYLKSEIKNSFDIPILAGKAYTYADGKYLSEVYLKHSLPDEKLSLSLGVDDSVKVKRKALIREEQNAGLIDKTTKHKRRYETKILNLHPVTHEFRVYDRIPKTQNAKIEIIWKEPQKNAVKIEDGSQVFYWELEIPAMAEENLYTDFEIIQPREWTLGQEF